MKTQKTNEFPLSEEDRAALTRCIERGEALLARLLSARGNLTDALGKQISARKEAAAFEARVQDAPEDVEAIKELQVRREQIGLFEKKEASLLEEIDGIAEEFRQFGYAADDATRNAAKSMLPAMTEKIGAALAPYYRSPREAREAASMTPALNDLDHYARWRIDPRLGGGMSAERALESAPAQLKKIARILDGEPAWEFQPASAA